MSAGIASVSTQLTAAHQAGFSGDVLTSLVGLIVTVTALATIGGRLLGIRMTWRRAIIAGWAGLITGLVIVFAASGGRSGRHLSVPAVLLVALVVTMVIATLLELLTRPTHRSPARARIGRVPHPVRRVRSSLRRARRYGQIVRIAARHGLIGYLPATRRGPGSDGRANLGRSLRQAIEDAGGIFIKLGQALSTRTDLLPRDVVDELVGLQDAVAPAPYIDIAEVIAAELGAPIAELFAEFDPTPLATASIGQVHRARLVSGEHVVVKVRRPGVDELVERDLDILLRLARGSERRAAWARLHRILQLADAFASAVREELDFRIEARNTTQVARASGTAPGDRVVLPATYPRLSGEKILVLEWLDGASVRDAGTLLETLRLDRAYLARQLLEHLLRQILITGVFHADPHPGNVMVLTDGRVALIDFGTVGRLDILLQTALRRMLIAITRRNPSELLDAITDIAEVRTRPTDLLLERAVADFMTHRLDPGSTLDVDAIGQLLTLLLDFGIVFPPTLGAVFRALGTLEGTLQQLAPGFQLVDESRAIATAWAHETPKPATLRDAVNDELLTMLPIMQRLPRRIERIATAAERGTLGAHVRLLADEHDVRIIREMLGQTLLAFLGAALGLISVHLLDTDHGPQLTRDVSLLQLFGYIGLFLATVLILRVVIGITRDRDM